MWNCHNISSSELFSTNKCNTTRHKKDKKILNNYIIIIKNFELSGTTKPAVFS